jgi:signal transduction histidine kinase
VADREVVEGTPERPAGNRKARRRARDRSRVAHKAGLAPDSDISLQQVDRRRTQLWTVSLFVVTTLTVVIAILALGGDVLPDELQLENLSSWVVVVLVGGLALAFLIYVLDKERNLRELARMLIEEREKIARLQEMDRLKSDFVATVSHELKTPLTAIIGAAKTVGTRGDRMNEEQHGKFMDMIERQGTRLLRLVEDVLDTARIESGGPHLRREHVDLRKLAEDIAEDLAHTDLGVGRVITVISHPEQPSAWGDPTALQQILGNLVENALKYSKEGSNVSVTVQETVTEAIMEVTDEGQGISPEQIVTIFDRFRQADSAPARGSGGFGLGLYIVKNLVATHRGDVEVESELGKGTTFRVRLPKRADDAADDGTHDRRRT